LRYKTIWHTLENGQLEYRSSYKSLDCKYKQKSKGGFKTKALANVAAIEVEHQLNKGIIEVKEISFYGYLKKWAKIYKEPNVAKVTFQHYKNTHRILLNDSIFILSKR